LKLKIAWHDPCNLGKMSEPWIHWEGTRGKWGCLVPKEGFSPKEFRRGVNGVYDQPREILSSISGLELLEMPRHHEFSWCCGGHGGAQEAYPELVAYSVSERLEEAKAIGAEAIVSACPYCKQTFLSGLRGSQYSFKIYDITEVISQAISK
jgi:Fe-S oxidoreductase